MFVLFVYLMLFLSFFLSVFVFLFCFGGPFVFVVVGVVSAPVILAVVVDIECKLNTVRIDIYDTDHIKRFNILISCYVLPHDLI